MGGAIFNMQGELTVRNSTFSANSAIGGGPAPPGKGLGGAVFNLSGSFTAVGSTLAANSAADDGASIYNLVYDAVTARQAQTTLQNTIVSGGLTSGSGVDLASDKPATTAGPSLGSATASVADRNLVQTMAARNGGQIVGSPLTADPLLGPLQDNGGPTQTMAPADGSPVIDAGSAFGLTTDQRGLSRPFDFSAIANTRGRIRHRRRRAAADPAKRGESGAHHARLRRENARHAQARRQADPGQGTARDHRREPERLRRQRQALRRDDQADRAGAAHAARQAQGQVLQRRRQRPEVGQAQAAEGAPPGAAA